MSIRRQEIEQLWTDDIQVLPGRRPINFDVVEQLAQSMDRIGLRHPITVRAVNEIAVHLVAGGHRLEAAKKLGWEKIPCVVLEADECSVVEAELWEIAENLHRADLTKKQRDAQIRRYAQLIAIRDADLQSRQNDGIESKRADKRGHRPEGAASKVAKETGVSIRTVQRALAEERPRPVKAQNGCVKREEQPAPVEISTVEPSEFQSDHDTSGMWRSRLRELMGEIDKHLECAPSPVDRAYGLKRLDGKWQALPPHNADGEIIEEHTAECIASPPIEAVPVATSMSEEGRQLDVSSSQPSNSATTLADTASGAPEPAVPLASEANRSPTGAQNAAVEIIHDGIIPDLPAFLDRRGRS